MNSAGAVYDPTSFVTLTSDLLGSDGVSQTVHWWFATAGKTNVNGRASAVALSVSFKLGISNLGVQVPGGLPLFGQDK